MSKENHNESSHWKNKLETAAGLPEQLMLDKEASWEKLQYRLDKKPYRKIRVWYWAAAIVLLLLVVPFLPKRNNPVPVASNKAIEPQPVLPSFNSNTTNEKINQPILIANGSGKKIAAAGIKSRHIHQKNGTDASLVKHAVIKGILPDKAPGELNIGLFHPIDTSSIIAMSPATTKKKLKTIHINELEPPSNQMASFKLRKGSYSDIRFGNRMMSNAPVVQSSDHTSIFKIKF